MAKRKKNRKLSKKQVKNRIYGIYLLADTMEQLTMSLSGEVSQELKQDTNFIKAKAKKMVNFVDTVHADEKTSVAFGNKADELFELVDEFFTEKLV